MHPYLKLHLIQWSTEGKKLKSFRHVIESFKNSLLRFLFGLSLQWMCGILCIIILFRNIAELSYMLAQKRNYMCNPC